MIIRRNDLNIILVLVVFIVSLFSFKDEAGKVPGKIADGETEIASSSAKNISPNPEENKGSIFTVIKVIDGDTIEIEGGKTVRYIGIDAPETVDPRRPVGCFGKEASEKNKELVLGKKVRLEKDVSETDKYGRLLRYVYFEDLFINDYLVRQGYAYASSYPPDIKYQKQLREAQAEAIKNEKGLWFSCESVTGKPKITDKIAVITGCAIKGNINTEGVKIYHLPECEAYEKTVIDEKRGERMFCAEEEAAAAGWKKAGNCP